MDVPQFRLSNFVRAGSNLSKFEIIGKTIMYDPRSHSARARARSIVDRARAAGVTYSVESTPAGNKIILSGRRKDVRRALDPTYRSSSTRRSSSGKRRSATRRRL